ncbi:methyltransferase domain-containing protein [Streptomyces sp. NBC_01275]|uniref:methyltransferase domain-containing protein n=1 Tax=Streptomyces sp. NBC_01275 TaxID=2903807 RepID=UPI00224ED4D1|nr:methyltransferase domain-containing protein [Streptomyces sp. NBC_01275]MCX4762222.1 methyltransferase domain-containing protein [Streptomyces sp. NBC_01275]
MGPHALGKDGTYGKYGKYGKDDKGGEHLADLDDLADSARAALVRAIEASGAFAGDPRWREAFATVPRHLFVPYYYVSGVGGYQRIWGESPDPRTRERWMRGAYEDTPLATRLRDGELLSSSSQPSLMALMLAELRVEDGDRVLEIGAGTGYNAALLAYRLGDENVTTVDLDPEIAESARSHLATAGHRPAVVVGDGASGAPERAPFDRIMATCQLASIPRPWLAQSRPGALILTPLATGLVVLTVRDAGHAEGRFLHTPAYFVPLRGESRPLPEPVALAGVPHWARESDRFRFLLSLTRGALDPQEAHALWEREGRPDRQRYGITVDADHAWAWLDEPEGPYTWPLPGSSSREALEARS